MDQVLEIDSKLRSFSTNDSCKAILFTGEGDKAFCAGGDVLHIANPAVDESDWVRRWFSSELVLNNMIANYPKPVVSIWRGIVMGGGVGLSIYGSHRIASESTIFAMPETSIGFFPDVGASYFLSHKVKYPGLGLYLGMTGHRLTGADTVKCGLATHFVPSVWIKQLIEHINDAPSETDSLIYNYATEIAGPKTLTPEFLKSVDEYFSVPTSSFDEFFVNLKTGAESGDSFVVAALATVRSKCPLTVRVWFESFKLGSQQTLPEALAREYHMCIQATEIEPHNFRQGVEAVLVNKGKGAPPLYLPSTIEEVTPDMVDRFIHSTAGGDIESCLRDNRLMY